MGVISIKRQRTARDLIEYLASIGRYSFVSEEAREALNVSPEASKLALNRLAKQGQIASPARGFYVIIPPEYRSLACLPADQFIPDLMAHKKLTYYAGLLTAAQYYGAAHQRPQEFQVFVQKNRNPIHCGKVRVKFIARKNIDRVLVRKFNTSRGELRVSTPEVTAIDLAGHPGQVGGLDQVATILSELADQLDASVLAEAAATVPITWVQRLGYILELVESEDAAEDIKKYVHEHAREYTMLIPGQRDFDGQRLRDWKLIVNAELEPDI
jgi:predicted transcriptional regulator of viral defense system